MTALTTLATFIYIAVSIQIVVAFFRQQEINFGWLFSAAFVAIILHGFSLDLSAILYAPSVAISNLSVAIWFVISCVMSLVAALTRNVLLLPIVYVISALSLGLSALTGAPETQNISVSSGMILHIAAALLTFGASMLASLYAIQLHCINYVLKHHMSVALNQWVPPLLAVEKILFKLIEFSVILLTISLVSGFVSSTSLFAEGTRHKTLLSMAAWLVFSGIIVARYQFHMRGKRVTGATIIATALLSLAYFGSRFVKEILLS